MKVNLREIPSHRRFELGPQFVAAAVSGLPMRAALERPAEDPEAGAAVVEVDLHMDPDGENVFVRGRLDGWVDIACSRCVGPVRLVLSEPIQVTYMPAARVPSEDEDEAADGDLESMDLAGDDDLDVYPYDGEEIDLEPLVREQIILAVPFAPLCREDCKGLCPVCGTDLNTGDCTCDRTPIDPRWSALKNLKT